MVIFNKKKTVKVTTETRKMTFDELEPERLSRMVSSRESFEVIALGGNVIEATKRIEHAIEAEGLRCRVYTMGRVAACGLSFGGGITGLVGVGAAVGIAYHNLYTYNPDYEIGKDLIDNRLEVTFKKSK